MDNMVKKGLALLAMAGLCTAAAADTATASFSMGPVRYELSDLNLTDGIVPALTFGKTEFYSQIWPIGEATVVSNQPGQISASNWDGSATLTNTVATLSGTLNASNKLVTVTAMQWRHFTLTPNTSVTFYVDGAADTNGGSISSGRRTSIWSNISLEAGRYRDNGPDGDWDTDTLVAVSPNAPVNDTLTVSTHTYWGDTMAGVVLVGGRMESNVHIPGIPEPSGYAMLGAGLLALALRRRVLHSG